MSSSYFLSIPELEKIPWIISWIRQEHLNIVVTTTTLPRKLFHALRHLNSRLPCSQPALYIRNPTGHFSYSPIFHHTLLFTVCWLSKSIGNILSLDTGMGKTYWGINSVFSKFTSKWMTVVLQDVFSAWFQPLPYLMSDDEWENILSGPERDQISSVTQQQPPCLSKDWHTMLWHRERLPRENFGAHRELPQGSNESSGLEILWWSIQNS